MRIASWPARKNAEHNPYQKLLYDALEQFEGTFVEEFHPFQLLARRSPDVLHVHWPDAFLAADTGLKFWVRLALLRSMVRLAQSRGTTVVWTAHNLQREGQRNQELLEQVFWPWFLGRIDGVIFMTEASAKHAQENSPRLWSRPHTVIPHGHYKPVLGKAPFESKPSGVPQALFFGGVSRYKNAWQLLNAFLELPADVAKLAIKGKMSAREPDTKLLAAIAAMPEERRPEFEFDDRFLTPLELHRAILDADLVVLPYAGVQNSGVALYALSVGRPILASNTPLFRELQSCTGPQWIHLVDGNLNGTQLLETLHTARTLRMTGDRPDLSKFEWESIARQTMEFYRQLTA